MPNTPVPFKCGARFWVEKGGSTESALPRGPPGPPSPRLPGASCPQAYRELSCYWAGLSAVASDIDSTFKQFYDKLSLDKAAARYVRESEEEESRTVEMYDTVSLVSTRSGSMAMQTAAGTEGEPSAGETTEPEAGEGTQDQEEVQI